MYSNTQKAGSYAGYFVGNVYVSGVFTNPSDTTLKEGIQDTENLLEKLKNIKVKDYYFRSAEALTYGFPKEKQTGFIAQELAPIFPNLVHDEKLVDPAVDENATDSFRNIKSVNYIGMVPILTKAIQEQQVQIESQLTELENQKKDIAELLILLEKQQEEIDTIKTLLKNKEFKH